MTRRRWSVLLGSTALAVGLLSPVSGAAAAPPSVPHFDHVVIVMEENRDTSESLGNPDAPWINALARSGALMTQTYAEAHPSQPDYLALFSGSTQGVTDNACPYSFTGPNLASSLSDAGRTFTGYSEDLRAAGSTDCFWNSYARKHNPWVDFTNVPASVNQPYTAFPTDFSTLPSVSFVVPNLAHDMHDGTVAQGDAWLAANMDGYVTWATTHNSLFVLTWDESNVDPANQIATIVAGAGVVPGSYPETTSHYSLLRTVEDAFGLAPIGASASASPLVDIFSGAPAVQTSASDTFTRTTTGGWGAADVGGPWATSPPSAMAVNGTQGTMALTAGLGASAYVGSVSTSDTDLATSLTTDKPTTGSGVYVSLVGRRVAGTGDYRAKARITPTGTVSLTLERASGTGAETMLTSETSVPGLTATPGTPVRVRVQVTGTSPTTLRARAWAASSVEPTTWTVTTTDPTAALQSTGSVGVFAYLSSAASNAPITVSYDDLVSQGTAATVQNKAPTAAFTTGATGLTATFNGSGSTDPEGAALTYAWAFGDGATAAGATATHTYAAAGSFPVTLTVTDPGGLSNSVTRTVAVAPPNQPPTAAFTAGSVGLTASLDASSSTDPEGGALGYAWSYGDGTSGTGVSAIHTYAAAGSFTVSLTVTDPGGLTSSTSHVLAVAPANQPPTASFTASSVGLTTTVDASGSSDPEGRALGYAWDFGDGATATGATSSHTYATAGTYTVTLVVTDPGALTSSASRTITLAPANQPPTAAFTAGGSGLTATVDASGSSDPEGGALGYAWDFGDGATATGATSSHTYATAGTYSVALTVTDPGGLTATTSRSVTVAPPNQPPTAAFTSSSSNLTATLDASTSSDPEGGTLSYAWNYGDGTTGTGATPSHTYAAAGTFTVTLTVTDPGALTNAVSHTVTVTAPVNQPPTAAFTSSSSNLTATLDASTSSDPEGGTLSYAWNYGDGTTGTGATPSHTYAAAGTYTVTLTVTDPGALTNAVSHAVTVSAPVNQPPTAAFTSSTTNLTAALNAAGSSDPEGGTLSYAWNYGDSTTGTGVAPSHTYAAAGTYTVTLTVTDPGALTNAVSHAVTVTAPSSSLAGDTFTRTLSNAWGNADLGGAWTVSGTASNYAVSGGVGTLRSAPGGSTTAFLTGTSSNRTDLAVTLRTDRLPGGTGIYTGVVGRRTAAAGDYRVVVRLQSTGAVSLKLERVSSTGVETTFTNDTNVAGVTLPVGSQLRVRLQVTGTSPTTLLARAWRVGTTEPTTWNLTATDSTAALQTSGAVGVTTYLSSAAPTAVVVSVDDVVATKL
jgi:PKD repeat protein